MKIFAKRKKTAVVKATDQASLQKTFASDPLVQELLKKDPSEWNAKEKRMVKRYQKRLEETNNHDSAGDDITNVEEKKTEAESDNKPTEEQDDSKEENILQDDEKKPADELSTILDDAVFEALNSKQRRKLSRTLAQKGESGVEEVVKEATQIVKRGDLTEKESSSEITTAPVGAPAENDEMAQVEELLKGLNSKQKRKLSRRLQREGDSCLAEVKAEAEELLKGSVEESGAKGDGESSKEGATLSGKKRKRRRGAADWSGLTPEERLRREEQKKMQQEAAERRANGEENSSAFKHPLNSERRRANRRKPKYMPKSSFATSNSEKIEHHASGFNVRKFNKSQY